MKLPVQLRYMLKRPMLNHHGLPCYEVLASDSGWLSRLIRRIRELHDRKMLPRACRQGARWQVDYPGTGIAVNVSARALRSRRFAVYVEQVLDDSGLPPWLLTLEFLEGEPLDLRDPIVRRNLRLLHELGVVLSLDDVGTGCVKTPAAVEWLLSNAPNYCISQIKLDMTLVQALDQPSSLRLARDFMTLARRFHLTVVAEGVETDEQLVAVLELGCHYAQGYHPTWLGPKVDAAAATQWLASHYGATPQLAPA